MSSYCSLISGLMYKWGKRVNYTLLTILCRLYAFLNTGIIDHRLNCNNSYFIKLVNHIQLLAHHFCTCKLLMINMSQCQLLEMNQQMGDQSEYCSSLGAAVCTLLWRVSRQQDSVMSLLEGVCNLCISLVVIPGSHTCRSHVLNN